MEQDLSDKVDRHLIITVHGIRTFGQWQERLEMLVKSNNPKIEVLNYKYGYFSVIAFLIPFLRWIVTKRFRRGMLQAVSSESWDRVDIVAHSFGTHLVGWGLYGIKPDIRPKINTVIFAGSVLKPWFPWEKLLGRFVARVVNDCGIHDGILLVNQIFVLFTGMAGRMGFAGMTRDDFRNRFFAFGHSGYFQKSGKPDDTFMREKWIPLLLGAGPIATVDDPRPPSAFWGLQTFLINNAEPLKLTLYLTPLVLVTLWINGLRLEALAQRQTAIARALASQSLLELQTKNDERAALLARQAFLFDTEFGESSLAQVYSTLHQLIGMESFRSDAKVRERSRAQVDNALRTVLGTRFFRNTLADAKSPNDWPYSAVFSPNGKYLASGSAGGLVRIWDLERPRVPPTVLLEGEGRVMSTDFSPDGKMLAAGGAGPNGREGRLYLWNLAGLDGPPRSIWSIQSVVTSVAFSHDSQLLGAGGEDGLILVVRTSQQNARPTVGAGFHRGSVEVAFSPNRNLFATAGSEGTVNLWNTDNLFVTPTRLVGSKTGFHALAFSPNGKILAASSGGFNSGANAVRLWNLNDLSRPPLILEHGSEVVSLDFSPDGEILASGSAGINLWHWSTGKKLATFGSEDAGWVETVRFSPDGRKLASANAGTLMSKKDIGVHIWNLGHPVGMPIQYGGHSLITNVALSPDKKMMASGDFDGKVLLWKIGTGDNPQVLFEKSGRVNGSYHVAFSPDSSMLVSGGSDGILRIWNLRAPLENPKEFLRDNKRGIRALAFNPRDSALALSIEGSDRTESAIGSHSIILLDLLHEKDSQPMPLAQMDSACNALSFSPNGELVACGSNDGTVTLWNLQQRTLAPTVLKGHHGYVWAVAFSHDGKFLASGGNDERILIWSVGHTKEPHMELKGHERGVRSLVFSNDGKTLASGSRDRTARLWNLENPDVPPLVFRHGREVNSVVFHPEDPVLVTASGSSVYIWLTSTELLANSVCEIVWRDMQPEEWSSFIGSAIPQRRTCQ